MESLTGPIALAGFPALNGVHGIGWNRAHHAAEL